MISIETEGFNPEKADVQDFLSDVKKKLAHLEKAIISERGKLTLVKIYPDKTRIKSEGFSDHLTQQIERALGGD